MFWDELGAQPNSALVELLERDPRFDPYDSAMRLAFLDYEAGYSVSLEQESCPAGIAHTHIDSVVTSDEVGPESEDDPQPVTF